VLQGGDEGELDGLTLLVARVRVDDVDTALRRVERLGGTRTMEPVSVPGKGWIAVFTDLDGNPVGLLGS
jgi:predicted enzyme related to lactoylglutathione lyase